MTTLGDWTTCVDPECHEWQTCTKVSACCLSKEDYTPPPARGLLDRNGRPISKENLIAEQDAVLKKLTAFQAALPDEVLDAMADAMLGPALRDRGFTTSPTGNAVRKEVLLRSLAAARILGWSMQHVG